MRIRDLYRVGVAAVLAVTVTVVAQTTQTATAAPGDVITVEPPGMSMRHDRPALFTGASGYLFYADADDFYYRWHISGAAEPVRVGPYPNGIVSVTADGERFRNGASVLDVGAGTSLGPPQNYWSCPRVDDTHQTSATHASPSLTVYAVLCDRSRFIRFYDYDSGDTWRYSLPDLPDNAASSEVIVNDDGSFRLIVGHEGSDFFSGPGISTPGQWRYEYAADGTLTSIREPVKPTAAVAAYYSGRVGGSFAHDIDIIGGAALQTKSGAVYPFALDRMDPPPAIDRDQFFNITFLDAVTSNGYGSGCVRTPDLERRFCFEGNLLTGRGSWYADDYNDSHDNGTISADERFYVRRTSATKVKIQQVAFEALPDLATCFGVAGAAGDFAVVNVTPVAAAGRGYMQAVSSDLDNPPEFSNANYGPGTVDPNVAVATIGGDGEVCLVARVSRTHVAADHLGTIDAGAFTPARANGAPQRKLDTRTSGQKVAPNARRCFNVAGQPGDFAVLNLTPVGATRGGFAQLVSSDLANPPVFSNANFGPATVDPNVGIAPIGGDNRVCMVNSDHGAVHFIADHLGTIDAGAFTPARANGAPQRTLDTRER